MAKPKTKGVPIQVRLPLDTDAAVRARALKQGVAPAVIIQGIVQNAYRVVTPIDRTGGSTPAIPPDALACTHPKAKVTNLGSMGVKTCECGATCGVNGTWR